MVRRLPPLNCLRGFEAVARLAHVGKASLELGVTHSAISYQIKTLEEALDTKLFDRVGRHLRLTEAGQFLLPSIQQALDTIADVSARVRSPQLSGRLTLATAPGFAAKWLVLRLGKFGSLYPQIELSVVVLESGSQRVPANADICVLWGDGPWEGQWARLLTQLNVFPVCSPQLMNVRLIRTPDDLRDHNLIHTDDGTSFSRWLVANGVSNIPHGRGTRFSNVLLAIDAASFGYGVALADNLLAGEQLERGTLVRLFDKNIPALHQYHVVCDRDRLKSPMVQVFLEWLLSEIATLRP